MKGKHFLIIVLCLTACVHVSFSFFGAWDGTLQLLRLRLDNSLGNAVPSFLVQNFYSLWQLSAQPFHIIVLVDVTADVAEAACKLVGRLFPRLFWKCHRLTCTYPRHDCLVQKYFLQIPWLVRLQPVVGF